ncbi:MAG: M1 family metallopeptidase [Jiangellaceae bacterium]
MRPRSTVIGAAVAMLATVLAGTAVAAPGDPGTPRYDAGAEGAGDPYFPLAGNGGFDVTHYDLSIRYTPPDPDPAPLEGTLSAVATIDLTPTADLDQFNLDLRGLTVESVTVGGKSMDFSQDGKELVVTPRPKLKTCQAVEVVVTYGGTTTRPTDIEGALYGWVTMRDGAMVANEPEGASTWFPVSDHPTDKATYDFTITVPEGLVAVANGDLVGSETADGWTTWTWSHHEPMASYLATASVGNYELRISETPSGLPLIDAIDKDLAPAASAGLAQTVEMIELFETKFGPYPFDSYGAIVDDDSIGYALETQTRPIYSRRASENTVAHELAHMWLGDSVSPEAWQHIWLNEGWASYATWLWIEHDGGASVQSQFDDVMSIPADDEFWDLAIADPGPFGLFHGAVYDRGAATLYALRVKVGDAVFDEITLEWTQRYADSTVSTDDFQALAEEISGQDLENFFDVWVWSTGKPTSW